MKRCWGRDRLDRAGRQERARLAGAGDVEVIPGPGAGDERLARLADQGGGSGGHADGMGLEAGRKPRANPFGKKAELLGPAGRLPRLRARAVHGRAVAEQ